MNILKSMAICLFNGHSWLLLSPALKKSNESKKVCGNCYKVVQF